MTTELKSDSEDRIKEYLTEMTDYCKNSSVKLIFDGKHLCLDLSQLKNHEAEVYVANSWLDLSKRELNRLGINIDQVNQYYMTHQQH